MGGPFDPPPPPPPLGRSRVQEMYVSLRNKLVDKIYFGKRYIKLKNLKKTILRNRFFFVGKDDLFKPPIYSFKFVKS